MAKINKDGTVTLSKEEYEAMQKRIHFLDCLESLGVDNWHLYSEAWQEYHETYED